MMKLKIETTHKETTEVDVDFPFCRQHDVGGDGYSSVIYTRIEFREIGLMGPLVTQYSIHVNDYGSRSESFQIQIETVQLGGGSDPDYTLARGMYACTREEFDDAAAKAEGFLARVRGAAR